MLETFIEQVREVLIQSQDSIPKHELYNRFINECKVNNFTEDDFYKKVLKPAHKSIDWEYVEEQKKIKEQEQKQKEEKEKAFQQELELIKKHKEQAPKFIDRLVKSAFEGDMVEKRDIELIFNRAEELSQDIFQLAEKVNALIDEKGFKAYPKADMTLPSLRQTLCSTDWHSEERYAILTTPPRKTSFRIIAIAIPILLLGICSLFAYFLFAKFQADIEKPSNDYIQNRQEAANVTETPVVPSTTDNNSPSVISPKSNGLYPYASERLLTYSDISGLSKSDLKIMRNEIFARHGYIFKTSDMRAHFSRQSWYSGRYQDVSSMLSSIESKNVAFIKSHE